MYEIKLPFKTPTINHLYWHRGNIKIMTTEAKKIREKINQIVQEDTCGLYGLEDSKLKVTVEIHEDWFCKNGSVKKKDVANREKFLIDSVFGALGLDDKFIFEHNIFKVQDTEEFAIVRIEESSIGKSGVPA